MDLLELPKVTKNITDHAGIFSVEQVESLSRIFVTHEHNTTEQVLTVLIPHRQGHELLDIGLKLFNENGIGKKDLNNGLLLIISTEEKKIRIITGKGMEIKYSEMVCREIIEKYLRPLLNEGKYEEMVKKWGEIVRGEVKIVTLINISTDKYIKGNGATRYLLSILLSLGLISCLVFIYRNGILDFLLILVSLLFLVSYIISPLMIITSIMVGFHLIVKHTKIIVIVFIAMLAILFNPYDQIREFSAFIIALFSLWIAIESFRLFRVELRSYITTQLQGNSYIQRLLPHVGVDRDSEWALLNISKKPEIYTIVMLLITSILITMLILLGGFESSREYYCNTPRNGYCSQFLKEKEEARIYRANHPEEFTSKSSSSRDSSSSSSSNSSWGGGGGSSNGGGYGD